jgi:hypothetical protein
MKRRLLSFTPFTSIPYRRPASSFASLMSTIVTFQPALAKAPPISPAPMTFHFALGMSI